MQFKILKMKQQNIYKYYYQNKIRFYLISKHNNKCNMSVSGIKSKAVKMYTPLQETNKKGSMLYYGLVCLSTGQKPLWKKELIKNRARFCFFTETSNKEDFFHYWHKYVSILLQSFDPYKPLKTHFSVAHNGSLASVSIYNIMPEIEFTPLCAFTEMVDSVLKYNITFKFKTKKKYANIDLCSFLSLKKVPAR